VSRRSARPCLRSVESKRSWASALARSTAASMVDCSKRKGRDSTRARISAIDAATTEADANLAADKASKLKWQVDVVELSNTADSERSSANTADLARQNLAGIYRVKENAYEDQAESYDEDMAQFSEEITGVTQIVAVIQTLLDAC